jgi:hypothetical protein
MLLLPLLISCAGRESSSRTDAVEFQRISTLLEKLRTGDIEAREAAMPELIAIGPDALPVLQMARELEGDAEVAARLSLVIEQLSQMDRLSGLLGRPPLVQLVGRMPLDEILAELARQSGIPVGSRDVSTGDVADVNIRGVPIWEAVNAVCRTAGLTAEWSSERVTFAPGPYVEFPFVDWKLGGRPVGRFLIECEWGPSLGIRTTLLAQDTQSILQLVLVLDGGEDEAGSPLFAGNRISSPSCDIGPFCYSTEGLVALKRKCDPNELRNFRGRLIMVMGSPYRELATLSLLEPGRTERNPALGTHLRLVSKRWEDLRLHITATLAYPVGESLKPERMRILVPPGPIGCATFEAQPLGPELGVVTWMLKGSFCVAEDAPLLGLQVVQNGKNEQFTLKFDFPKVPVRR